MLGLGDAQGQARLVKQLCVILVTKLAACEGGTTLTPRQWVPEAGQGQQRGRLQAGWLLNFFILSLGRL